MKKILKTAPAGFPITVAEVKVIAQFNNDNADDQITEYIPVATSLAEAKTGRVFINQVWEIYYDIPEFKNVMDLDTLNVNSIVQVSTFDRDNTETVIDSADYRLFDDQIVFNEDQRFTANTLRSQQAVKIEVNAGYAVDNTTVPKDIQSVLGQLIAYWVDNEGREDIPEGVWSSIRKYKKSNVWL
jgi:uncharacterized phiE125 gp8 family phage protein